NNIEVSFPSSQKGPLAGSRIENSRYTVGLLGELPGGWRGSVEASYGSFQFTLDQSEVFSALVPLQLSGSPTDLATNPLGDWREFEQAMSAYLANTELRAVFANHFHNETVRLAGPVFDMPAGPATLSLIAEHRADDAPATTIAARLEYDGTTMSFDEFEATRAKSTSSLYAELRTRIFAAD